MGIGKQVWIVAVLILLILFPAYGDTPATLTGIHIIALPDQSHLILDLNTKVAFKIIELPNPPRIAIDLPDVKLATNVNTVATLNSAISHIRSGHPKPNILRIVLDLTKPLSNQASFTEDQKGLHLVLELNEVGAPRVGAQTGQAQGLPLPTKNQPPVRQPPVQTVITAPPLIGNKAVVVVIDPGHGGKDPGTSGSLGVREKDVVLAIAINLQKILNKQPGYKAVLTRKGDYFIPLRGRLAITRKNYGNMFIAIHADAYKDSYATGSSVFALSAHGASSEAARWLAEKENYSELGGVDLRDKSDMLRSVLIDLSQTATISSSLQLGSLLISQLGQIGNLHYRYVEQAPFMVLKSPDIPSVLVETGFLSNPQEQARLRNPCAQMQIAKALAWGIMNYFQKNPPPGTLVAALQNQKN